ncbi:MAG: hypothetical protein ACE5D8_08780 [Fidelibacterota bacterium]
MSHRNWIILTLGLVSTTFSQSVMNGFGIGQINSMLNVSSLAKGSFGLTPDYSSAVALNNPATWHHLKYSYIQNEYAGRQITRDGGGVNRSSGLNRTQVIIPIKQKYSIGLSLAPFSKQQLLLAAPEDSLANAITFNGEGGANIFRISIGGHIDSSDAFGFSLSYLFGSSRQEYSVFIDETLFRQTHRLAYDGILLDVFFSTRRLESWVRDLSLYGQIRIPITALDVKQYSFFPFEDNNASGYHDRSNITSQQDFPDPGAVPGPSLTVFNKQYSPTEIILGAMRGDKSSWISSIEIKYLQNNSAFDPTLSPFYNQISGQVGLNLALSHFGPDVVKEWWDRFRVSTGYFYNNYALENRSQAIIENGIALGFGFKFGTTENTLGFSYQLVNTTGLPGGMTEFSNRFAVGISLGDIWFIKRRQL